MSWRVVNGEAAPGFIGHFGAEDIAQGLAAMDVQVVHYQVDGLSVRVFQRQGDRNPGKFKARTVPSPPSRTRSSQELRFARSSLIATSMDKLYMHLSPIRTDRARRAQPL